MPSRTGDSGSEVNVRLEYYPETDTLYISFSAEDSVDSDEIADETVADFAKDGRLVGIEIDHASKRVDLGTLEAQGLPAASTTPAATTGKRSRSPR
jgi:uncharacterized protein YuzE